MDLRKRLAGCADYAIDMRLHVLHFRLLSEQINEDDVRTRLENLKSLDFANLYRYTVVDKHKFKLYFRHSKSIFHKYVIDIRDNEKKIRLVTVHRIHGRLQKEFEKYAYR